MFGKYRLQRLVRKIEQALDGKAAPPIDFGAFRRITPISRDFGYDRGQPIDRHYIEGFLLRNSADIRGDVLEIGDDRYTKQFGSERVTKSDILNYQRGAPGTTIHCDLSACQDVIADNSFDCVIITQTIQMIYDVHAVGRALYRILKPGGRVLATMAGISQISRYDMDQWGEYWHFTDLSARRLFEESFTPGNIDVATYGNVLASISFLHGLASRELFPEDLDAVDRDYQMIVAVRAQK